MSALVAHDCARDVGRVEDDLERVEDGFLAERVERSGKVIGADMVQGNVVRLDEVETVRKGFRARSRPVSERAQSQSGGGRRWLTTGRSAFRVRARGPS